jgi:DNA-binding NarL/FixJ family response regulator
MKSLPKVIIVDDHTLFREGMHLLIEKEGLGEVVAEAQNGNEFLKLLNSQHPDIVLMDIEMPQMNGIDATQKALEIRPNIKILALTMQSSKDDYIKMVKAGVMGFVLKTAGKYEFQRAITTILAGEQYFCNEILQKLVSSLIEQPTSNPNSNQDKNKLTDKESVVLQHLCKGLSVSEIAEKIHRSVKTVEKHRSSLLEKTNTKNTINLILYAIKNKMVEV